MHQPTPTIRPDGYGHDDLGTPTAWTIGRGRLRLFVYLWTDAEWSALSPRNRPQGAQRDAAAGIWVLPRWE